MKNVAEPIVGDGDASSSPRYRCPNCGSSNVTKYSLHEKRGKHSGCAGCLIGLLIFLVIIVILLIFIGPLGLGMCTCLVGAGAGAGMAKLVPIVAEYWWFFLAVLVVWVVATIFRSRRFICEVCGTEFYPASRSASSSSNHQTKSDSYKEPQDKPREESHYKSHEELHYGPPKDKKSSLARSAGLLVSRVGAPNLAALLLGGVSLVGGVLSLLMPESIQSIVQDWFFSFLMTAIALIATILAVKSLLKKAKAIPIVGFSVGGFSFALNALLLILNLTGAFPNSEPDEAPTHNQEIVSEENPVQPKGPMPINDHILSISSSSSNPKHPAEHAIDGNLDTAWNDKAKGNGSGAWLEFIFDQEYEFINITFMNGYQKTSKKTGKDLFYENSRVKTLKMYFDGTPYGSVEIPEDNRSVEISINKVRATKVRIEAEEVWPGRRWGDLCVSELLFLSMGNSNDCFIDITPMFNGSKPIVVRLPSCPKGEDLPKNDLTLDAFEKISQSYRVSNNVLEENLKKPFKAKLGKWFYEDSSMPMWALRLGDPPRPVLVVMVNEDMPYALFLDSNSELSEVPFEPRPDTTPRIEDRSITPVEVLGNRERQLAFVTDTASGSGMGQKDLYIYRLVGSELKLIFQRPISSNYHEYSEDGDGEFESMEATFGFGAHELNGKDVPAIFAKERHNDSGKKSIKKTKYLWDGRKFSEHEK